MTSTPTPRPRRAEPLQPDRPGRGDTTVPAEPSPPPDDSAKRQKQQSEDALDNTREGYD